jgi:hypothetical protein
MQRRHCAAKAKEERRQNDHSREREGGSTRTHRVFRYFRFVRLARRIREREFGECTRSGA